MAALGSQSIASSYEQLLHVDANGGGNGTTHVAVKDGDNGTTFGFTIATDALMMTGTNRLEFGDTGTYIHQSADGVLDLVSDTELELNATTIEMNGAVKIVGSGATDHVLIENTNTGADNAPDLVLYRNSSSLADSDSIGRVEFRGRNDNTEDITYANLEGVIIDASDGAESSRLLQSIMKGGSSVIGFKSDNTEFAINESGVDMDFRVEAASSKTNALFVQGSSGNVGIGTNSPNKQMEIRQSAGAEIRLSIDEITDDTDNNDNLGSIQFSNNQDATGAIIQAKASGDWATNDYPTDILFYTVADSDSNLNERVRIDNAGSLYIGDSANANMTTGLTINQGAADNEILSFKSSDVAHGITGRTETDTYGLITKAVAASGGVFLGGLTESEIAMTLDATSTADVTDKNTSANGNVLVRARKKSGTGDGQSGSNANLMVIENYDTTRFIFDAEGDFHADSSSTTFDHYNDAHLVRAYDLSHGKGVIKSKFDEFVDYQHENLAELGLVGREKDGTPNHFINVTGMQRLHNGAIWQQYTEMQKMKELMYDTMVEMLGKSKADEKLKNHNVKLLENKDLLN